MIVTGASAGIGEAAAAGLAARGARVHMVGRDHDRLVAAAGRVRGRLAPDARAPEIWQCDLSDLEAVRDFVARFRERGPDLRGIVHNAGVLVDERRRTAQGHELTVATHVLGPLLLTGLLAPELRAAVPSRVVFVSSGGMYTARVRPDDLELEREEFDGPRFYAHAKRLQVIVAEQLAERWRAEGIAVYSMHRVGCAPAGSTRHCRGSPGWPARCSATRSRAPTRPCGCSRRPRRHRARAAFGTTASRGLCIACRGRARPSRSGGRPGTGSFGSAASTIGRASATRGG